MSEPAARDRALPNLPSRDLDATEAFYAGFGFERSFRDDGWMILRRGDLQLEFFPFVELDPADAMNSGAVHASHVPDSRCGG